MRRCYQYIWRALGTAFVLIAATASSGCGTGDPYFSSYLRTEPVRTDLIGTWTIEVSRSSVPFTFSPDIAKAQLLLKPDGSFEAKGLPREAFYGSAGKEDVAGVGNWKLNKSTQGLWQVELEWPADNLANDVLWIRNQSPEYLLHCGIDDPDLGYGVVFRRTGQTSDDK